MNTLSVTQIAVGGFDKNFSYIVADSATQKAFIVDPSGDIEKVFTEMEVLDLTLAGILITHTHFDHIEKLEETLARKQVPVYVHANGADSMSGEDVHAVGNGEEIPLGSGVVSVLHTPGHTDDSVCYYISPEQTKDNVPKVITGDTLFVSRCGKTTPQDAPTLYESLQQLKELPDETVIYSGHDYGTTPTATIGHEKEHNQYLTAPDFETFRERRFSQ